MIFLNFRRVAGRVYEDEVSQDARTRIKKKRGGGGGEHHRFLSLTSPLLWAYIINSSGLSSTVSAQSRRSVF